MSENPAPRVWTPEEVVPKEHCQEARRALQAYHALSEARAEPGDLEIVREFRPWYLDVGEVEIAGRWLNHVVYATVYDALADNVHIMESDAHVFRGHSDARWQLLPSAARYQTRQARGLLEKCRASFLSAISSVWPDASEDHKEALCQHYGIPTDLLDVTQVIEIAAFFAHKGEWNEFGCIWAFDADWLIQRGLLILPEASDRRFNHRLHCQKGGFLRVLGDDTGEILDHAKPLVFGRRTMSRGILEFDGGLLTPRKLFPADGEDTAAMVAGPIAKELQFYAPVLRALEESRLEHADGDRERTHAEVRDFIEHSVDATSLTWPGRWLLPQIAPLVMEELTWSGNPPLMDCYLRTCGAFDSSGTRIDLSSPGPQARLLVAAVTVWAAGSRHPSVNESRSLFDLVETIVAVCFFSEVRAILRIFGSPEAWVLQPEFANRRLIIVEKLGVLPQSYHGWINTVLRDWFWNENDESVLDALRDLKDRIGGMP